MRGLENFGRVAVKRGATEWQRRMFLAPEPNPFVAEVKRQLRGVTLTAGDAVELMDAIRQCTKPEEM
jgi:hypothetical protein